MYFHHTMTRNFAIDPAFSWDLFMLIAEKAVFFLRKTILLAENGIRKEEKRFAEQMMSKAKPYEYRHSDLLFAQWQKSFDQSRQNACEK